MNAFLQFINEANLLTFASGIYLIALATGMDTGNFKSAIIFKCVPMILGFSLLAFTVKDAGIW